MSSSAAHPTDPASEPNACACASASTSSSSTPADPAKKVEGPEEKKLAPLKGAEFRAYNRLAEHMDLFHAHFRTSWNTLWAAACAGNSGALGSGNKSQARQRARALVSEGLSFVAQLEMHHNIEETYIFPALARKMPEFQRGDGKKGGGAAELLRQHEEIHVGMEGMRGYLRRCRDGEEDLDMAALKAQMQSWGTVLWTHLDQEVQTLGAENMRKYWTVDEIRRIPM